MTTNLPPVPAVSISMTGSFDLPSQEGKKGRPRTKGRVHLTSTDGAALNIGACQRALAAEFDCKPKDIQPYPRETRDNVWAFIVPGVEKDTGLSFSATMVRHDAAVAADAAPAVEAAGTEAASADVGADETLASLSDLG